MPERLYGVIPSREAVTACGTIDKIPGFINPVKALEGEESENAEKGVRFAVYEFVGYAILKQTIEVVEIDGSHDNASYEG